MKCVSQSQLCRCLQSRIDEVKLKLAFNKLPADARNEGNQRGEQVGFVSHDEALKLAPMMDGGARLRGRVARKMNPYRILVETMER